MASLVSGVITLLLLSLSCAPSESLPECQLTEEQKQRPLVPCCISCPKNPSKNCSTCLLSLKVSTVTENVCQTSTQQKMITSHIPLTTTISPSTTILSSIPVAITTSPVAVSMHNHEEVCGQSRLWLSTGSLLAVITVLIIGWTGTCIVLWKKTRKISSQAIDNVTAVSVHPMDQPGRFAQDVMDLGQYDTLHSHQHTDYNSPGPKYEQVELNTGNYDVIDRRRESREPPLTLPRLQEGSSDQQYGRLSYSTEQNQAYDVLESAEKKEDVDEDHHYFVLESTQKDEGTECGNKENGIDTEGCRDYEIPVSKNTEH